jgi:hypothetical protein
MLARLAIRIATVEALKGATFVDGNVLDSQIGALDVAVDGSVRSDQEKPFLSVYTDGAKVEDNLSLRPLHQCGQVDITVEAGITTAMVETDEDTGESQIVGIGIPATDPAMEMFLDCIDRQVANALTDPDNEWAELWRGLSSGIVKVERKRTSDSTGTRIAAHQTVITLNLLPDPAFGEPVAETSVWAKLIAKLEDESSPYLSVMQDLIGAGEAETSASTHQRRFGMTLDEVRALFGTPVVDGADEVPIADVSLQIRP